MLLFGDDRVEKMLGRESFAGDCHVGFSVLP